MSRFTWKILLWLLLCRAFLAGEVRAQTVMVHGTVMNMYKTRPMEGVSVLSTSGRGTATDSNGNYAIVVQLSDSISFSYLGKATAKYPVSSLNAAHELDIALHVDPVEMKEVRVMPRNYTMDSLQNRKDYAKIFNFKKPGLKINDVGNAGVGLGVGIDLDELINVFRFQRTRRILAFQHRLLDEEKDNFIDHRFNPSVVLKVTHLTGDELDTFMIRYRPSYEFCKKATDYDLYDYIKLAFQEYQKDRKEKP